MTIWWWWSCPPPVLQIYSLHQVAMGTPSRSCQCRMVIAILRGSGTFRLWPSTEVRVWSQFQIVLRIHKVFIRTRPARSQLLGLPFHLVFRKEFDGTPFVNKKKMTVHLSWNRSWRCINCKEKNWWCINGKKGDGASILEKKIGVASILNGKGKSQRKAVGASLFVKKNWRCFRLGPALEFVCGPNFWSILREESIFEWRESR